MFDGLLCFQILEKWANLRFSLNIQKQKVFQELCPWTPLGASPPDPRHRLALHALAMPPLCQILNTPLALGSHVTFVRRNSARVVTLRNIYFVIKVWSCTFAVNVQWVFSLDMNCDNISWNTQILNSFAVVYVVNISGVKSELSVISTDVLLKLGYVNIFARQDWDLKQTICGQLLVGQNCFCWPKTCQWGHSLYLVVGAW